MTTPDDRNLPPITSGRSFPWSNAWFDAAVVCFLIATTYVGMWNFPLRMATLHQDDGPILFAHAFKSPEMFRGDYQVGAPIEERVSLKVGATVQNSIPAVLWKYFNIDPYSVTYVLTFAQAALLGLALYAFSAVMTGSRQVAALSLVFALLTASWGWNLANYNTSPTRVFDPYPAFSAIVMGAFGLTLIAVDRWKSALAMLLLAGWFHPNIGLYACTVAGLFLLPDLARAGSRHVWLRLVGLAIVAVAGMAPGLVVNAGLSRVAVEPGEAMQGMRCNQHIWPWGYEGRWGFSLLTTVKWFLFASLAWRCSETMSRSARRLWLAALGAAALLGATHVLGAVIESPALLRLIGLRSSLWFALVSLPLVINYWRHHLVAGSWTGAVAVILCLVLPVFVSEYGLFWPPILVLALQDVSEGRLSFARISLSAGARRGLAAAAFLTLAVWLALFVVVLPGTQAGGASDLAMELVWGVRGGIPGRRVRLAIVIGACLVALVLRAIARSDASSTPRLFAFFRLPNGLSAPTLATVLFLGVYGLGFAGLTCIRTARAHNSTASQNLLEVQRWAREESPRDAVFVALVDGWRTQTLRRQFDPVTREAYSYFASKAMRDHRARLLQFYGFTKDEIDHERGTEVYLAQRDRFRSLTAAGYDGFAREFGATHLVLPATQPNVMAIRDELPVVYENPRWVVFRLNGTPSSLRQ